MTQWKFLCSTAFVALVAGNAALADVTPEEVWANWKALSSSYGQTIATGSEARQGDALVITDLTITSGNEMSDATMTVPQLTFTQMGDGTVTVTMSDSYPMAIRGAGIEGEADTLTKLTISHPGMVIHASGSATETRYDFSGPSVAVKLDGIEGPADAPKPEELTVEGEILAIAGNYIVSGTETKALSSNFTADQAKLVIKGNNPADGSKVDANVSFSGLTGTSSGKVPAATTGDFADALKAGASAEGGFTYASATYEMTVAEAAGDTKLSGSSAGGDLTFAMDAAKLAYGGSAMDVAMAMSGGQMPFPINLAYKEGAFSLTMPVSKTEAPSDFSFLTKVVDLTISDAIWNMIDPSTQLPREPITVVLDAKGTAKMNVDLLDEKAMMALGDAAPGELHSLDLSALQIKAAGAEITGTGALTFDNSDLVTFGGVPAPTGQVDLKAVGLNGLLDKVTAMGLVPEDQIMGTRMMLGMFAKMVDGQPDTMTSTLEFKDKGFFANGMQLQ